MSHLSLHPCPLHYEYQTARTGGFQQGYVDTFSGIQSRCQPSASGFVLFLEEAASDVDNVNQTARGKGISHIADIG
jgi:hypothetical protein